VDTKKRKKVNITEQISSSSSVVKTMIDKSVDYLIAFRSSELDITTVDKELILQFNNSDLKSDIFIRIVIDSKVRIKLKVIINAPQGVENCESKLDMKALVLNDDSEITFVPSLEIDEMNVSVDHKSTLGRPDPEWVSYMQSRGLSIEQVTQLISASFMNIS
jgi:Fe-S cluster assembly scaffold protein SufB